MEFSNAIELQEKLDAVFPEGVKITFMRGGDVPNRDDNIILTPRVTTKQYGPETVISFETLDQARSYTFPVTAVEEDFDNGGLIVRLDEEDLNLFFSNQFSGEMREVVKQARARMAA